jgi:hypothetical protein
MDKKAGGYSVIPAGQRFSTQSVAYYFGAQGNRFLEPPCKVASINDPIHCRERLGGMLNFYYREAA